MPALIPPGGSPARQSLGNHRFFSYLLFCLKPSFNTTVNSIPYKKNKVNSFFCITAKRFCGFAKTLCRIDSIQLRTNIILCVSIAYSAS